MMFQNKFRVTKLATDSCYNIKGDKIMVVEEIGIVEIASESREDKDQARADCLKMIQEFKSQKTSSEFMSITFGF